MLIGELSKLSGLSRDTIRFYEKVGLIKVQKKERRENNYKEYSEAMFKRIESIKLIKGFGFTLNEVSEVLDMIEINAATCNNISETLEEKVNEIDKKIRELIYVRTLLQSGLKKCRGSSCNPSNPGENCQIMITQN